MGFPRMIKIRQQFSDECISDIDKAVAEEIGKLRLSVKPGMRIAVTAGSRGIANIAEITKQAIAQLKQLGADPFIVPAMGSHGGATAHGQIEVLTSLGITEDYCGAPIHSSMDVVEIGELPEYGPIYFDKNAWEADGVLLIGRIKLHTDYRSPKQLESGLIKMATIGLGKHKQALQIHSYGIVGLRDYIPQVAKVILDKTNILGGLAIVENAYEKTAIIEGIQAADIFQREPELLQESSKRMPSLPIDDIDVLLVDEIGKDYSGTGMDTNIIGRIRIPGVEEPKSPNIRYITASDVSEASHGNVLGVGLADFTTEKLLSKMDRQSTNENVVTSTFVQRGMIPLVLANDQEALEAALRCNWGVRPGDAKVVRIANTLHLGELLVSESLLETVQGVAGVEIIGELGEISFDSNGNLSSWENL